MGNNMSTSKKWDHDHKDDIGKIVLLLISKWNVCLGTQLLNLKYFNEFEFITFELKNVKS